VVSPGSVTTRITSVNTYILSLSEAVMSPIQHKTPPHMDIRERFDQEPLLGASLVCVSPTKECIAIFEAGPAPFEAQPSLTICGVRAREDRYERATRRPITSLQLLNVLTGKSNPIATGDAEGLYPIGFSPDGTHLAFVINRRDGPTLAWTASRSGQCVTLAGSRINNVLDGAACWCGNGCIVCRLVSDRHVRATCCSERIALDTSVSGSSVWGYDGIDWPTTTPDSIRRYFGADLAVVDIASRNVTILDGPKLYRELTASPDGRYILATVMRPPASSASTLRDLTMYQEVIDVTSAPSLRATRLQDEPGHFAGPGDPLLWRWQPFENATLIRAVHSAMGDRIVACCEPFRPREMRDVVNTDGRCTKLSWTTLGRLVIWEYDEQKRSLALRLVDPAGSHAVTIQSWPTMLPDRNYSPDPTTEVGSVEPLWEAGPSTRTLCAHHRQT
jgi:hypothetical protein